MYPLTERRKAILEAAAARKGTYSEGAIDAMRGLVVSRLEEWMGESRRLCLIAVLFGGTGSTKPLTGAQLSALLDWMALKRSPMGDSYAETDASRQARQEMDVIIDEHELPGMPAHPCAEVVP